MKHTKESHAKYLQSDHWQETRKWRIEEGTGACERCEMPRWLAEVIYKQELHVHHLHYRTKGHEAGEDLEVLCRRCHEIETFGRSEFKLPKTAKCDVCRCVHWNYRSDLCDTCKNILSLSSFPMYWRVRLLDPSNGGDPVWKEVLRQCVFAIRREKRPVDDLKQFIDEFDDLLQSGNRRTNG